MLTYQIYRFYNKRNLIITSGLTLFVAIILIGIIVPNVTAITGTAIPDVLWGYTQQDLQQEFQTLTQDNGILYYMQLIADSFFPFLYALLIALGMVPLQLGLFKTQSKWHNLVLLPFVAAILDYTENFLLLSQFLSYPNLNSGVIAVASIVTQLKWIMLGGVLLLLLCEGIAFLSLRIREEKPFTSA